MGTTKPSLRSGRILIAAALATCFMAGFVHGEALPIGIKYASLAASRVTSPVLAPQSIVLFFDWQSAELTPDAKAIVGDAVAAAKRDRSMRIELTAFSAPDEWTRDRLLASRRAASVKAEIARLGFKGDVVATGGRPPKFLSASLGPDDTLTRRVIIIHLAS
jgi:outer membrane protein OmpA-like peptidoglycan-associated protein